GIEFDIVIFAAVRVLLGDLHEIFTVALEQLATIRRAAAECIQSSIEPTLKCVLCGARERRGMNLDIVLLSDAIETADTLFKQVGIERQIPHDEVMCELEVTTFRSDFRTK